jgi:hypothetical protein
MKRLIIMMLTLLFLGCLSAFAQKAVPGEQEKSEKISAVQVDKTTRPANQPAISEPVEGSIPVSVDSKNTEPTTRNTLPPGEIDAKTPNPEAKRTKTQPGDDAGVRTVQDKKIQGPSAKDDPKEVKPDDK